MQDRPTALHSSVSADYAKAIGMRVVAGRWVTDAEREPVFVVNESLARGAFPGEDPIGKRIQTGGPPGATAGAGATFGTIVGVVADLKYTKLDASPEPEIFADYCARFAVYDQLRGADDRESPGDRAHDSRAG